MAKQWKRSLILSDILSDGTPFDGANIDQPISNVEQSVNALNDLSQSDILSDGTPFDGSNIDAAISSAGGVDWSSKSPQSVGGRNYDPFGGGGTETSLLSISGSGYLNFARFSASFADNQIQWVMLIDSTVLFNISVRPRIIASEGRVLNPYGNTSGNYYGPVRFDSSVKLKLTRDNTSVTSADGNEVNHSFDYVLD